MLRFVLMLFGFIAAQSVSHSAISGERGPVELDDGFTPVAAYGVADGLGRPIGMVVLQAGRFHCPEGRARAVWFQWVNGAAVVGCWRDAGAGYVVDFEDNDQRAFGKPEVKEKEEEEEEEEEIPARDRVV
jgi:hypothetical protein